MSDYQIHQPRWFSIVTKTTAKTTSRLNQSSRPAKPAASLKLMFDFCSSCLWDARGHMFELEKLSELVPPSFFMELGAWRDRCDAHCSPSIYEEDFELSEDDIKASFDLDVWGIRLAQSLTFYLRHYSTKIKYSFLTMGMPDVAIICPRPPANSYICSEGMLYNLAEEELNILRDELQIAIEENE